MRNVRNILLVILSLSLNGCVFTANVWTPEIDRNEVVKDLLINADGSKLVLVGKKYDYLLDDDKKMIQKLFQSGTQSKLMVNVDNIRAKGEGVEKVKFIFQVEIKTLSPKQVEFLRSMGAKVRGDNKQLLKIYDPDLPGSRTISGSKSSEYQPPEFVSTGFIKSDQKTTIFEDFTPLQKTGKILITPFTLATDIVLLPLTIPMFFYHQIRKSQTSHFCEGEFCGYDKLSKDSKSKK